MAPNSWLDTPEDNEKKRKKIRCYYYKIYKKILFARVTKSEGYFKAKLRTKLSRGKDVSWIEK